MGWMVLLRAASPSGTLFYILNPAYKNKSISKLFEKSFTKNFYYLQDILRAIFCYERHVLRACSSLCQTLSERGNPNRISSGLSTNDRVRIPSLHKWDHNSGADWLLARANRLVCPTTERSLLRQRSRNLCISQSSFIFCLSSHSRSFRALHPMVIAAVPTAHAPSIPLIRSARVSVVSKKPNRTPGRP